ncbi:hypothetical protein V8C37DRAFT_367266 [Trichoderma ceciliae]
MPFFFFFFSFLLLFLLEWVETFRRSSYCASSVHIKRIILGGIGMAISPCLRKYKQYQGKHGSVLRLREAATCSDSQDDVFILSCLERDAILLL